MNGGTEADVSDLSEAGGSVGSGKDDYEGVFFVCGVVVVNLGPSAEVESGFRMKYVPVLKSLSIPGSGGIDALLSLHSHHLRSRHQ